MSGDSHTERIYRAMIANYGFDTSEHEDREASITDAMTDLLHLCDEYGIDAESMLARIWRHYVAECNEGSAA